MLRTRQSSSSAVISAIKYQRAVFFVGGLQFPLCLRCTGLLLGTFIFMVLNYSRRMLSLRLALLMIAPMFIDIGLHTWLGWQGDNATRLLTGIGAGAGLPAMMLAMIVRFTKKSQAAPKGIQRHSQTYL